MQPQCCSNIANLPLIGRSARGGRNPACSAGVVHLKNTSELHEGSSRSYHRHSCKVMNDTMGQIVKMMKVMKGNQSRAASRRADMHVTRISGKLHKLADVHSYSTFFCSKGD